MAIAFPHVGQVIQYSYLWRREADRGLEEGRKNRPCALILALENGRVAVVPITHSTPEAASSALEIPHQVKKQLGLDAGRSWIVTSEYNVFRWPGYDLAPFDSGSIAFGTVPPGLLKLVITSVRRHAVERRLASVSRDSTSDRDRKP